MYDITIIGSGPGGYAAALRCADHGARVCVVEKDLIGGVCLNRGCIPTKSIIQSIKTIHNIKKAAQFGFKLSEFNIDMAAVLNYKNGVVLKLRSGAETLLKSKRIDIVTGEACFTNKDTIQVNDQTIKSNKFIIATGSSPIELGSIKFDHKKVLSSDDMLDLNYIPESLVIIGGGYIGCEFASIYSKLGTKVTIIELLDQLIPSSDKELARRLESIFKRGYIDIIKRKKVTSVDSKDKPVVILEDSTRIDADTVLLSVGRRSNIDGLNLDVPGIEIDNGNIKVNENLQTNIESIYAIGDVTGGYRLAHVATHEGIIAADNMHAKARSLDTSSIPSAIFTIPEIASVGLTEEEAKSKDINYKISKIPFAAVSKAHIAGETEGFIKILFDSDKGRILGAHILGASASELISNFSIAIKNELTVKDLSEVIIAHPTLSEGISDLAIRSLGL
ncbi:dihydrolipoyl dehydrogenase [Candidatus Omnitrophota bacterium]